MVQLQYGFLCLGYFVTGRYSATVQDTANLPELAYSRLNVTDPLGWDVLDALELLSGFLQKFGGIIDFTGSDLAEGHLSDGLCKTMDSGVFDRSRSLHSNGQSCLQVCRWTKASGYSTGVHSIATLVENGHVVVW